MNESIRTAAISPHVFPRGFHRIRHYGLLASARRKANVERARALLAVAPVAAPAEPVEPP